MALNENQTRTNLNLIIEKLGGNRALQSLLERFYQQISQDVLVGFFFAGKDLKIIAQKQCEFLLKASNRRPTYLGNLPGTAHLSLAPILPGHFDRRLMILRSVLSETALTEEEIEFWIEFENAFRPVIEKSNK